LPGSATSVAARRFEWRRGRELERLAAAVEERCAAAEFPPEERAYNPHLTLARARQRRGARIPELPPPPELDAWTVDGFRLYRSRPGAGGAVYSVLEEFGGYPRRR